MSKIADDLKPLRDALRATPENIPLRLHLVDSLRDAGGFPDAEAEYRKIIRRTQLEDRAFLGLGSAIGGKISEGAI